MENGTVMSNALVMRGAGQVITSPSGPANLISFLGAPDGHTWTVKHNYVGLNVKVPIFESKWVTDGLNEKGLAVAMQTLPNTEYQTVTDKKMALAAEWVVDWILGTCATIDEVKKNLNNVQIWGFSSDFETYTTAHYSIFDAEGKGLVLELLNGNQVLYDDTIGVCTNGPTYDWHLTNISNYTGLQPLDAPDITINGQTYKQPGLGSGLMGIPGDSTPPSRFVRIAYLKQFADRPQGAEEAVIQAFHLLNTIDIPRGTSRSTGLLSDLTGNKDYTQYVSVRDQKNLVYYMRFAGNPTPIQVDLKQITFSSKAPAIMPVPPTDLPPAVVVNPNAA